MTRTVSITNRHPRLRFSRHAVARAIHLLDEQFQKSPLERGGAKRRGVSAVPPGELSVVFLTDPALAKIHGDFMGDPTATDVITFEGDATADLAGEICVSVDTAARYVGLRPVAALERRDNVATLSAGSLKRGYAQKQSGGSPTLQNKFSTELTLYVVHGWLHLAGYDDLQPAKKRRMRAAEARAMKLLQTAKAVPEFWLK